MKTLVIVESPAKAGTISKILGKDFEVASSFGHIRDLAKDGDRKTGIDIVHNYTPHYVISPEKKKVVADLKKKVKNVDRVLLATDEDREGEAISWHLYDELNLTKKNSKRITFTEITPHAITHAVEHPRDIYLDLVDAQQARRVLDRLVGFELTGLLWKKIRAQLSAGRVQSVAVRLIVEKEREIQSFKPDSYYKTVGVFLLSDGTELPAEYSQKCSHDEARQLLEKCAQSTFVIDAVEKKPSTRKPSPPFTTSTLQQAAGQKLGFSVSRTMSVAQKLYEAGHITYMRTDSMTLSKQALGSIAGFIESTYGKEYVHVKQYKNSSKSSQEAHEAIRPTYIASTHVSSDSDQQKLYTLIRARTLSSQMADAKTEKTTITIQPHKVQKGSFVAKGEIVLFDGFLRAFEGMTSMASEDILLPTVQKGEKVTYSSISSTERHTKPPARYSEATLVKKLEELGIGRPSTYAPTIAKITSPTRGYISKETREGVETTYAQLVLTSGEIKVGSITEIAGSQKNKLFAHEIGLLVTDFLTEHFKDIMDYSFTAEVEDKLDDIASGKEKWVDVIDRYYKPFSKTVSQALESAERVTGEKILGKDPSSGRTVLVRLSKYGPVVQIGAPSELTEDEKPQYAQLLPSQSIETITLQEALTLFTLPKVIGTHDGFDVVVQRGRFGPYVTHNGQSISLPRSTDPFTVSLETAVALIDQKAQENAPVAMLDGTPITRGKGRFGPYLKWGDTFVSVTKKSGIDFEAVDPDLAIKAVQEKIKADADKLLHSWLDGKVTLVKGRWGPIVRVKGRKGFMALPVQENGKKHTPETLSTLTDAQIKKLLKLRMPSTKK